MPCRERFLSTIEAIPPLPRTPGARVVDARAFGSALASAPLSNVVEVRKTIADPATRSRFRSPVLVILQFFPRFTTVNPGLSALPLIAVLTITALKDGYEDLKRHQSDRAINGIQVRRALEAARGLEEAGQLTSASKTGPHPPRHFPQSKRHSKQRSFIRSPRLPLSHLSSPNARARGRRSGRGASSEP